jgi:hypothetical protein
MNSKIIIYYYLFQSTKNTQTTRHGLQSSLLQSFQIILQERSIFLGGHSVTKCNRAAMVKKNVHPQILALPNKFVLKVRFISSFL